MSDAPPFPLVAFRLSRRDYGALTNILGLTPGSETNAFCRSVVQTAVADKLMELARDIHPAGAGSFGVSIADEAADTGSA